MKSERRILQEVGIDDPLEVFDPKNRGHIKDGFMISYRSNPDEVKPVFREEIEKHFLWCQECKEKKLLPLSD